MLRLVAVSLAVSGMLVCTAAATATQRTALTVSYWADGTSSGKAVRWTLQCGPASGTIARPALACARLARAGWRLFAPVPKNAVCTELYGGPQVALVVGVVQGRRVWAKLQRRDGCEIARWNRMSPWLLPRGGAT